MSKVGSELDSRLKGRGFESHTKLDVTYGFKAMPGSIIAPNSGSFNKRKRKKI